jgi:hypothetical protein
MPVASGSRGHDGYLNRAVDSTWQTMQTARLIGTAYPEAGPLQAHSAGAGTRGDNGTATGNCNFAVAPAGHELLLEVVETLPPSFRKSPGQRGGHRPGRGSRPRDDASLRPRTLHDDRGTRSMLQLSVTKMTQKLARFRQPAKSGDEIVLYCMGFGPVSARRSGWRYRSRYARDSIDGNPERLRLAK